MPYVKRDPNDNIVSITQKTGGEHTEYLSPTSDEIVDFLSANNEADLSKYALAESDRDIARVTEDLIHLLISKNIILFTDLPDRVQQKLLNREKLRSSLSDGMNNFLDDEESI